MPFLPSQLHRSLPNLERQGYHTFYPCMRHTVRHARKSTSVLVTLLSCCDFVFVQLDVSVDPWRSINGMRGVIRLITNGEAGRTFRPAFKFGDMIDGQVEIARKESLAQLRAFPYGADTS